MEFFIRPRQDFTLPRMADALYCLSYWGFNPTMEVSKEKKKRIIVIRIEAVGDWKQVALKAIEFLVAMEHFDKNDFTFIEPPSEAAVPEVD